MAAQFQGKLSAIHRPREDDRGKQDRAEFGILLFGIPPGPSGKALATYLQYIFFVRRKFSLGLVIHENAYIW